MDTISQLLHYKFVWGLLLGLLVAGFIWKSGFTARQISRREIKRLEGELKDIQGHLNTQLKINASGSQALLDEVESLRGLNENLRVNNASLQQKPGRGEARQLQLQEAALRQMREQAPGFAPAWEKAMRQAEAELEASDTGLKKLVRRILPGILPASSPTATDESSDV